jgi:hypothetical protein
MGALKGIAVWSSGLMAGLIGWICVDPARSEKVHAAIATARTALSSLREQQANLTGTGWLGDESFAKIAKPAIVLLLGTSGLIAVTYRFFLSEGSARYAARRKFTEQVTSEISDLAKRHYWALANYSGALAAQLEDCLDAQHQLLLFRWESRSELRSELYRRSNDCTDRSFWIFCQLLDRFDDFQFRGSNTYLLATHAAGELAKKLYNSFVAVLDAGPASRIDTLKILRVLREPPPLPSNLVLGNEDNSKHGSSSYKRIADLPARAFLDGVRSGVVDLRDVQKTYREWMRDHAGRVEQAARSLRAYSELLTHELALLHEQWFKARKGLWTTDWPTDVISSESTEVMQRVRFESALLAAMPTRDEPQGNEEPPRAEGKVRMLTTQHVWEADGFGGKKAEDLPGPGVPPDQKKTLQYLKHCANDSLVALRRISAQIRRQVRLFAKAIAIHEASGPQVRGIRASQIAELYGTVLQSYVKGVNDSPPRRTGPPTRDDRFRIAATTVISNIDRHSPLDLRMATVIEALLGHSARDRGDLKVARYHVARALRLAKRAYRRINRMNELSVDRRRLGFFGSAIAILYRELALTVAKQGRFKLAEKLLVKASQRELDWKAPDEDRIGTLAQLKAEAIKKDDFGGALQILNESYVELEKRGANRMAGRTRFQMAKLLRAEDTAEAHIKNDRAAEAHRMLSESYRCYEDPDDPVSLATILEEITSLYIDANRIPVALSVLDQALQQAERAGPQLLELRGRCLARRGLLKLGTDDIREGVTDIQQAVALFRENKNLNPWRSLIDATRGTLDNPTRRARAQRLLWQVAHAENNVGERGLIVDLVMELLTEFGEKVSTSVVERRLPVEVPLVATIDERLITSDWDVPRSLELFRQFVRDRYGVKVPGVRFRIGNSLRSSEFEIEIIGVRYRFDAGSVEFYVPPGIDSASYGPFWKPAAKLFEMLETRLDDLVGHQEIQNMLEETFGEEMRGADLANFQTHSHIDPLATVCKALLTEGAPISDFRQIRNRVLDGLQRGESLQDTVEAVRAMPDIRTAVPGAGSGSSLFEVDPGFEQELWSHTRNVGSYTVLAAPLDVQARWIQKIEESVPVGSNLVLRNVLLRPLVRELVRRDLPSTQVVAYGEIGSAISLRLEGVVGNSQVRTRTAKEIDEAETA